MLAYPSNRVHKRTADFAKRKFHLSGTVIGSLPSPWHAVTDNLRRNRRRMLLAFVGASIMGGTVAGIMPASYRSESVLMVRLGQEYLVNADPATTSVFMERKEMVASEVAMLTAPELATRVIQEVGLNRIYPSLSETIDPAVPDSEHDAHEEALIKFARHLSVLPVKDFDSHLGIIQKPGPPDRGRSVESLGQRLS